MTGYERVKAAMMHRESDNIPHCIHLADDGKHKYYDALFARYVKGNPAILQKYASGQLSREHAISCAIGNDLLMSPEIWRELIRPGEQREYDLIHSAGLDVWVYSCGDVRKILPDLCEMGVDVLNPLQPECMDIKEIKGTFGDRLAFWSGITTQGVLPFAPPGTGGRGDKARDKAACKERRLHHSPLAGYPVGCAV